MPRGRIGLGALPAHDTPEPDHARVVGDAQHRLVDLDFLLVEQQQLLCLAAPAHVDRAAQLVEVVDVQRPAELEHHVVGHVDERGDGALPCALQAAAHPARRRRRRIDVADDAPGEAAATFGRRELDRMLRLALGRNRLDLGLFQFLFGQRSHLARNAEDREAVGAVRRELESEHVLVEIEQLAHVGAWLRVLRQLQQPRAILREAELACRAQHAVARHASQAGFRDLDVRKLRADPGERHLHAGAHIRRPADDLQSLPICLHTANRELVRIRMPLDGQHFGDHHAAESGPDRLIGLDLDAGHGQAIREFLP